MRRSRGPSKKEDKPYACDECNKTFLKESKLENHKKTHQRNLQQPTTATTTEIIQTLACPVCDKVFTDQIHLKNHIRLDHQPNPITQHETQVSLANHFEFWRLLIGCSAESTNQKPRNFKKITIKAKI